MLLGEVGASLIGAIPILWFLAALNVLTQYICIAGVYSLQPVVSPLTLNIVLTVRKFLSLLLSIVAFQNTFTAAHWVGAALVLGGASVYGILPGATAAGVKPSAAMPGVTSDQSMTKQRKKKTDDDDGAGSGDTSPFSVSLRDPESASSTVAAAIASEGDEKTLSNTTQHISNALYPSAISTLSSTRKRQPSLQRERGKGDGR